MRERNATAEDIRAAIKTSTSCTAAQEERWRLDGGTDLDGEALSVIVILDDGVLVVTLF